MERDYEKELNENALYQLLRHNPGCKIYLQSKDGEHGATFDCNGSSVYFYWQGGTYCRFDLTESCRKHNSKNLLADVLKIIRVEKKFEDKWLPIWTFADGFIDTDFQNFAYIHERYYTFKELEQIIEEVKLLKQKMSNLKVY